MVAFYVTLVQYQDQEIVFGTIYIPYLDFATFYMYLCMRVCLCVTSMQLFYT